MRKNILLLTTIFVLGYILPLLPQSNTSLHVTRNGKPYFYNTVQNGGSGGYETLTNIPISGLGCVQCHGATDANGNAYPTPYSPGGCNECHATNTPPFPGPIEQANCLKCHGREANVINLGLPDVHRTAGRSCNFCHKANDVHGSSNNYNSMFEPGAIATDCLNSGCHEGFNHPNPSVDPHAGKLHCTSCHAKTNLACYNCHFESVVQSGLRRAQRQITNFVFLVNRTKDNKVHPASYQSLSYQGQTWITFGPSSAHTIVKTGARTCSDCHQNIGGNIAAISSYNATGTMKIGTWNTNDSTLSWMQGVIPMPSDWKRAIKLDYITYKGNTSDPVVGSKNWQLIDDITDGSHMLFATPLTSVQMAKLGMDTMWLVPVELTSFTGSSSGLDVKLNWSTATELNNNGFEIQRKTNKDFATVGFVKGNGTTSNSQDYSFVDKQMQPGNYYYRLKQIDYNGRFDCSSVIEVQVVHGMKYSLFQNYPNPFNPETSIKYSIPHDGKVSVKIYNVTGKEIATLVNKDMLAGTYEVKWNGMDNSGSTVTSGVYFVKLSSGNFIETKKMLFLK